MTTFVLVPGGWHGALDYQPVTDRVRRLGHSVHAINLPGVESERPAPRPAAAPGPIDLDTHIEHVAAVVQSASGDVTLCGHSYGGMVITGVADRKHPTRSPRCSPADPATRQDQPTPQES